MRRKRFLSASQLGQIIKARNSGRTLRDVAEEFDVDIARVSQLCAKAIETDDNMVEKPRRRRRRDKRSVRAKLFEIERVLDRRNVGTSAQPAWEFLLKWKGYGNNNNSWEPYEGIKDLEIVQTFIEALPTNQ